MANAKTVHVTLGQFQTLILPLQTSIDGLNTTLVSLQTTLSSLQNSITSNSTNITSLQSDNTTNKNNITTLQNSISSLGPRVKAFVSWTITGTTLTIQSSYNATVQRTSIGAYAVTFNPPVAGYAPLAINCNDPLGKLNLVPLTQTTTSVNLAVSLVGKITLTDCNGSLVVFG